MGTAGTIRNNNIAGWQKKPSANPGIQHCESVILPRNPVFFLDEKFIFLVTNIKSHVRQQEMRQSLY